MDGAATGTRGDEAGERRGGEKERRGEGEEERTGERGRCDCCCCCGCCCGGIGGGGESIARNAGVTASCICICGEGVCGSEEGAMT